MKSGLKDVARVYIHADRTDGSSECRDEKRTERISGKTVNINEGRVATIAPMKRIKGADSDCDS